MAAASEEKRKLSALHATDAALPAKERASFKGDFMRKPPRLEYAKRE